jgi:hypothetical protein
MKEDQIEYIETEMMLDDSEDSETPLQIRLKLQIKMYQSPT